MVHGSTLNTFDRSRRILFYEMMAADALPIMGSMTMWDGIKDYTRRMLCGEPTIKPRLNETSPFAFLNHNLMCQFQFMKFKRA